MKKVLALSPHFDDAVLSAGQFIAGRPDVDVVTIFAGVPKDSEKQTDYDKKCGFKSAKDAISHRKREDNEALSLLRARFIHLNYVDSQYEEESNVKDISKTIEQIIESENYEFIIAPIGIGHPDHEIVNKALLKINVDIPIYLWEDMPLRVLEPELISKKLSNLAKKKRLSSPGTGRISDKIRAIWCYKSQIGTGILDPYIMYVPERFWLINENS